MPLRSTSPLHGITILAMLLGAACTRSQSSSDSTATSPSGEAGSASKASRHDGPARPQIEAVASYSAWYDTADACGEHRSVNQQFIQQDGYVLLESTDVTWCPTAEGARASRVTVQRWQNDSVGRPPRYRFEASGEEGRLMEAIYEISFGVSGGGDQQYEYFSLETGKQVFSSQTPVIRLSLDHAPWRRYLALTSRALQYGDGTRPSAQVSFSGMEGDTDDYCVERFGFLEPGKSEPSDSLRVKSSRDDRGPMPVPAFVVRAELSNCWNRGTPYWAEIPVVDDQLDLAHARTSEGLRLTSATP